MFLDSLVVRVLAFLRAIVPGKPGSGKSTLIDAIVAESKRRL